MFNPYQYHSSLFPMLNSQYRKTISVLTLIFVSRLISKSRRYVNGLYIQDDINTNCIKGEMLEYKDDEFKLDTELTNDIGIKSDDTYNQKLYERIKDIGTAYVQMDRLNHIHSCDNMSLQVLNGIDGRPVIAYLDISASEAYKRAQEYINKYKRYIKENNLGTDDIGAYHFLMSLTDKEIFDIKGLVSTFYRRNIQR